MFSVNVELPTSEQLGKDAEAQLSKVVQGVAIDALHHVLGLADEKLHSLKDRYMSSLAIEQLDQNCWLISLDSKADWIENGIDAGFQMLPGLLASPKAKTAKDGSKYLVVPLDRVGDNTSTPKAQEAKEALSQDMKQRGMSINGIEHNADGTPKVGTLHRFDVMGNPTGKTGIPLNQGVKIKQFYNNNGQIKRSVTTFRTASSKQNPSQYWVHSGLDALHAFPDTYEWVIENLDSLVMTHMGEL